MRLYNRKKTLFTLLLGVIIPAVGYSASPTQVTIMNNTGRTVYANFNFNGVPSSTNTCTNVGFWATSASDSQLSWTSSKGNQVSFTAAGGWQYYMLAPSEQIVMTPNTQTCPGGSGTCYAAAAFNVMFSKQIYGGATNPQCRSAGWPNGTNFAEATVNVGVNGHTVGGNCANQEATDISAVGGVNTKVTIQSTDTSWVPSPFSNLGMKHNANLPGVFGWAADACTQSIAPPVVVHKNCSAPVLAPKAVNGKCASGQYITSANGDGYCAEITTKNINCQYNRPTDVSGGQLQILVNSFTKGSGVK